MQADNSDRHPLVNLEITIPRMRLPTPVPVVRTPQADSEGTSVRLLYPDAQGDTVQSMSSTEASEHVVQQRFFRLFHLRAIPTQARHLLLQILRPTPTSVAQVEPSRVTDELALTLELRHPDPALRDRLSHMELTPGVQSVVIFLDEEGLPQSSSIDGAQV